MKLKTLFSSVVLATTIFSGFGFTQVSAATSGLSEDGIDVKIRLTHKVDWNYLEEDTTKEEFINELSANSNWTYNETEDVMEEYVPYEVVSYFLIAFFINKNDDLLLINGKKVLSQKQFFEQAEEKYLDNIINENINSYIIEKELEKVEYNDSELEMLHERFDDTISDDAWLFTYNVFQQNFDENEMQEFFNNKYGLKNTEIYEIFSLESENHDDLEKIREHLENNSLQATIDEYDLDFQKIYMFDLSAIDETFTLTNALSKSFLTKTYHVMNEDKMELLYVNKIVRYEDNKEVFEDMYFTNNYSTLKNNALNTQREEYTIDVKR